MDRVKLGLRIACLAAVLVAALWIVMHLDLLQPERVAAWLSEHDALAPWVFILARALGAVAFVPGSVMAVGAGIVFGPCWGAFYNLVASTAGAVLAFGVARFLAPGWVARKVVDQKYLGRLMSGVEAEGWRFVAFTRLVPLFPYNVLNYALGLTRIRLSHYVLASFVFMAPGDIAYVYLGFAGGQAVAGADGAVRVGLVAITLLAVLAFVPRFARILRRPGIRPQAGRRGAGD
jgi:uncharacterized membrane protein YdjX (TVP38/TMEM64 family)